MTESIVKAEKGGQASGFIALFLAAFVGGFIVSVMTAGAPPATTSPYEAWCRGFSDGVAKVLLDQGEIAQSDYETQAPLLDERCLADVTSANPDFTAGLRGPEVSE